MVMIWALGPPLVHELGHWLAARLFGSRLSFAFEWGKVRCTALDVALA